MRLNQAYVALTTVVLILFSLVSLAGAICLRNLHSPMAWLIAALSAIALYPSTDLSRWLHSKLMDRYQPTADWRVVTLVYLDVAILPMAPTIIILTGMKIFAIHDLLFSDLFMAILIAAYMSVFHAIFVWGGMPLSVNLMRKQLARFERASAVQLS